jgi:hypothetical protein
VDFYLKEKKMTNNESLVWSNIQSLLREGKNLIVLDFGCGEGIYADSIRELGHTYIGVDIDSGCRNNLSAKGYQVYHPEFVPSDLSIDLLLLGNMKGIDTGIHLVSVRKKLKDAGKVFMWDISRQSLPKGKSQTTLAMSLVGGE